MKESKLHESPASGARDQEKTYQIFLSYFRVLNKYLTIRWQNTDPDTHSGCFTIKNGINVHWSESSLKKQSYCLRPLRFKTSSLAAFIKSDPKGVPIIGKVLNVSTKGLLIEINTSIYSFNLSTDNLIKIPFPEKTGNSEIIFSSVVKRIELNDDDQSIIRFGIKIDEISAESLRKWNILIENLRVEYYASNQIF